MPSSPAITSVSWGETLVEGMGAFKDVKLWPGGGRVWDWRETGTRHHPGIQPSDIAELLDHGCELLVLGIGMQRALGVCPETLDLLEAREVDVDIDETQAAVARYNRLASELKVGGLFHSTC
ncbi:MAG: Mth938-like domain-containing protein [Acidimicrobiia bacterium]